MTSCAVRETGETKTDGRVHTNNKKVFRARFLRVISRIDMRTGRRTDQQVCAFGTSRSMFFVKQRGATHVPTNRIAGRSFRLRPTRCDVTVMWVITATAIRNISVDMSVFCQTSAAVLLWICPVVFVFSVYCLNIWLDRSHVVRGYCFCACT